jgi:threonine dehydrogenase-like Zn-dependent dehydrogenase
MRGVYLPGDRRVELRSVPDPEPGPGQVVVRMRASTICGSDLRAIYREHLGRGPEAYKNVIAGHEPAGEIVAVGPGCRQFRVDDRVLLYHISGCGLCADCRSGYMIGCTSPLRAAYGWQRDGGHADYLLADEHTCIALPDELSYADGACVACGFGTAYEALVRAGASARGALAVVGLGPVGLGAGMLGRALGAAPVIGVDVSRERCALAVQLHAVDAVVEGGSDAATGVRELTRGAGCEVAVDCSGTAVGRSTALAATRRFGACVLVGEGGRLEIDASPTLIHEQITLYGSWVTSIQRMQELTRQLVRWNLRPEVLVTHRFPLNGAEEAYRIADAGTAGKVGLVMS